VSCLIKLYKPKIRVVFLLGILSPFLIQCEAMKGPAKPGPDTIMPQPREVTQGERSELIELIAKRFKRKITPSSKDVQFRAAGPFRFVGTEEFSYTDRTDVGSVGFELSQYGVEERELNPRAITIEVLVPHVEGAFLGTGLDASGRVFDSVQDEFVGAVQPNKLGPDFDPRKASKHVARTVAFRRTLDGVPIFGSELLIGLMVDDQIGFRLHWPAIRPKIVKDAQRLQEMVLSEKWSLPADLRNDDIEILDVAAGVGHSGIADPGFRAKAVVRVLFRKTARGTQYPIASTGYKYFDESGKEVVFSAFPRLPGTPAKRKQ
jgi:hypothetical protein